MNSIFIHVASGCVLILIFLSQFVPTAYVEIKAAFLASGVLCILISMLRGKVFVFWWQVLGVLSFVAVAICYSIYGLMRGNPGAVRVLSIWLLWPIVYLIFTPLLRQEGAYAWLAKSFVVALSAVTAYGYLYLGWVVGFIPDFLYFELDQGQAVGFYDGFVEYNLYSISSLIFLIPFCGHFLLEKYKRNDLLFRFGGAILILTALLLGLLTGRRAVLLVLLMMPLVIIFSNKFLRNQVVLRLSLSMGLFVGLLGGILLLAAIILNLRFDAIYEMFSEGFEFWDSANVSASERMVQFYSLIDGWINSSILFGAGNGAAASISRSDEYPWAYELTYVYLLFSTGLVGFLFYFGWYGYGMARLRRAVARRPDLMVYAAPMLTGSISFCIAAATNPYFGKFDYLWIVFLPFLISGWVKYQKN